jgi:hypothetical protein
MKRASTNRVFLTIHNLIIIRHAAYCAQFIQKQEAGNLLTNRDLSCGAQSRSILSFYAAWREGEEEEGGGGGGGSIRQLAVGQLQMRLVVGEAGLREPRVRILGLHHPQLARILRIKLNQIKILVLKSQYFGTLNGAQGGYKEMSWLTNSAFVYESKCRRRGMGGGGVAGSQPLRTYSCTQEPKLTLEI